MVAVSWHPNPPRPEPVSVVVPAHNESAVIARTLSVLLDGAEPGELEVVVVCNGCSDDTAARARLFGTAVTVLETDVASKTHALNLGDAAATRFPRFYLDADVSITIDTVRRVVGHLHDNPGVLAAAPLMSFDLSGSNGLVRAYYGVWSRLPYIREGLVAAAYALTREGRARFGTFPSITADDAFVRLHFAPHERATVRSCRSVVVAPATLGALIRIKARSDSGNRELRAAHPELSRNHGRGHLRPLLAMAQAPRHWPKLGVYAFVRLAAIARGRWQRWAGGRPAWERDETSRRPEKSQQEASAAAAAAAAAAVGAGPQTTA